MCVEPACTCRDALMTAVTIDPEAAPSSDEMKAKWNGPEAMHAYIDIDSGAARPDARESKPLSADWVDYLATAVDAELLDVLREAWLNTKEPQADQPHRREAPKVSRNALCPCGSGKKYKHCCA